MVLCLAVLGKGENLLDRAEKRPAEKKNVQHIRQMLSREENCSQQRRKIVRQSSNVHISGVLYL